jgi:hypothetical protein
MSLIPVDAEYHHVQDTAPTSANAGDVWLDTSQNPPIAKIYADIGNGLEWLQDQSSDRIATNLDAPVSEAGQGVDWASKTSAYTPLPKDVTKNVSDGYVYPINISGSGYVPAGVIEIISSVGYSPNTVYGAVEIDGTVVYEESFGESGDPNIRLPQLLRFTSSLKIGARVVISGGQASTDVTVTANAFDGATPFWVVID